MHIRPGESPIGQASGGEHKAFLPTTLQHHALGKSFDEEEGDVVSLWSSACVVLYGVPEVVEKLGNRSLPVRAKEGFQTVLAELLASSVHSFGQAIRVNQ